MSTHTKYIRAGGVEAVISSNFKESEAFTRELVKAVKEFAREAGVPFRLHMIRDTVRGPIIRDGSYAMRLVSLEITP